MAAKEHKSMLRRNLEKVARNRLALIGIAMVTLVILTCVGAPLLTDYDPKAIDYSAVLQAPNDAHRLGTDRLGRDVFSRILYGGQMSIFIGVVSTLRGRSSAWSWAALPGTSAASWTLCSCVFRKSC